MTEITAAELTADRARELEQAFLSGLNEAQDAYEQIVAAEAWTQLGYDTFAEWWSGSVQPVMRALSMRPTREIAAAVIDKVRAEEADLPLSQRRTQRELADMAGVPQSSTLIRPRSTNERMRSESDLESPPPPKPEISRADLAEFPELEYYADRPDKVAALANQLRSFDPTEREQRRENLAKAIRAEQEGRFDAEPARGDVELERADRIFVAANAAAQEIEKAAGEKAFTEALPYAEPMQIELWRDQFSQLAEVCNRIAGACRPKLRRVQ